MIQSRRTLPGAILLAAGALSAAGSLMALPDAATLPGGIEALASREPPLLVEPAGLVRLQILPGGGFERELLARGVLAIARDAAGQRWLAVFDDGTLQESRDDGVAFVPLAHRLPPGEAAVALAVSGPRLAVAAPRGGVLVLDESAAAPEWTLQTRGLPASVGAGRTAQVMSLVAPAGASATFVGVTDRSAVVRSTDGGLSWQQVTAGPANPWRAGTPVLAAGEGAASGVLLLARPVVVNSEVLRHVLLRSEDAGASWQVAAPLEGPVRWLRVEDASRVLAGTDDGALVVELPLRRAVTRGAP